MPQIRSADPLYPLVTKALEESDNPQTCAMLMERFDIRSAACARFGDDIRVATYKLSDLLGFMWRKGLLLRSPAPVLSTSSLARYAYSIKKRDEGSTPEPVQFISPATRTRESSKQSFVVQETQDGVVLDFEHFTVVIRNKDQHT